MRAILFGASGMVGQGVLRVCEATAEVTEVLAVVRRPLGHASGKVRELVRPEFFDWSDIGDAFAGYDACFFCAGVSAVGMSHMEYTFATFELTLSVAKAVLKASPNAVFMYVSGQGTNANGRAMWARVKGETEDALMGMPFRDVYCFRPGFIQPVNGERSKVAWYNTVYRLLGFAYPVLRQLAGSWVTSTEELGEAMLAVATQGFPKRVLENRDIHAAARSLHAAPQQTEVYGATMEE